MLLPEAAAKPDDPVWLEDLPEETLGAMLEAGRDVLRWRRILNKSNDNVVGEVLKHEGQFYIRHTELEQQCAIGCSQRKELPSHGPQS
ncbi:MAG: hypothetical protein AAF637_18935, partial [Pseudomonadota bacterium]